MELATKLPLTESGTPVLLQEEVVRRMQTKVNLYNNDKKTNHNNMSAYITTHRLFAIDAARKTPMCWQLASVARLEQKGRFLMSSAKIIVHFAVR